MKYVGDVFCPRVISEIFCIIQYYLSFLSKSSLETLILDVGNIFEMTLMLHISHSFQANGPRFDPADAHETCAEALCGPGLPD
jgi:hypothetical protein